MAPSLTKGRWLGLPRRHVRRSFSVGGKGSLPSLSFFYQLDTNDSENPSDPADGATSP